MDGGTCFPSVSPHVAVLIRVGLLFHKNTDVRLLIAKQFFLYTSISTSTSLSV